MRDRHYLPAEGNHHGHVSTDAAGQAAYRLVRAKLVAPGHHLDRDDSVFSLRVSPQSVVLNRFGANPYGGTGISRESRKPSWNFNAFNNNSTNDTITAETRQYSQVGQPFTTAAAFRVFGR